METDLVQHLLFNNPVYVRCSFNRPNIFLCAPKLGVVKVYVSKHDVVSMNAKIQDDTSGIAECLTSKDPVSIPKLIIFFNIKALVLRAYAYLQSQAYHKHCRPCNTKSRDETIYCSFILSYLWWDEVCMFNHSAWYGKQQYYYAYTINYFALLGGLLLFTILV